MKTIPDLTRFFSRYWVWWWIVQRTGSQLAGSRSTGLKRRNSNLTNIFLMVFPKRSSPEMFETGNKTYLYPVSDMIHDTHQSSFYSFDITFLKVLNRNSNLILRPWNWGMWHSNFSTSKFNYYTTVQTIKKKISVLLVSLLRNYDYSRHCWSGHKNPCMNNTCSFSKKRKKKGNFTCFSFLLWKRELNSFGIIFCWMIKIVSI